ncbi:hypothetical protein PVAP13_7KG050927 [Panicum virgatum]|uniref:Uncharacterized protein n=1 Tax=Panicum virgatum TaxID=38727 RepID=A0A8T0QC53_PANVG|nr:hypothetical protein PVAP13_7KG050927 [Panicum virgatum]
MLRSVFPNPKDKESKDSFHYCIDGCSNGDHCNSQLLYPYLVSNIFEKILATMMIGCLLRTLWLQTV